MQVHRVGVRGCEGARAIKRRFYNPTGAEWARRWRGSGGSAQADMAAGTIARTIGGLEEELEALRRSLDDRTQQVCALAIPTPPMKPMSARPLVA